jgi:hypothetical protein
MGFHPRVRRREQGRDQPGPRVNAGAPIMNPINFSNLNFADAYATLQPLVYFVVGVAVYSIFVFNFYRFLARRDIFELSLERYEHSKIRVLRIMLQLLFYVFKYLVLFPIVAFAWFIILTVLLTFLAKNRSLDSILLVAMAVLSAIRVTAYYNEDLSRDLSKMLPFALLGVFLIDISYFSVPASMDALRQTSGQLDNIIYYLFFIIGLEFLLRVASPIIEACRSVGKNPA